MLHILPNLSIHGNYREYNQITYQIKKANTVELGSIKPDVYSGLDGMTNDREKGLLCKKET